jgi:hypothetical protein
MSERMPDNEPDPGADTEMFRAFVERSETYRPKSASMAPIFVAVGAVVLALMAFLIIIALG